MTFHSPITAASPLALTTAFSLPTLARPHDSAVVTIRKALEQLPEEVQESALEELELRTSLQTFSWLARRVLSSGYYHAFVRWAQAAVHISSAGYDSDAEGSLRSSAYAFELTRLAEMAERSVLNPHEALLHSVVLRLDLDPDNALFWPVYRPEDDQGYSCDRMLKGLVESSAILSAFNDVARAAWAGDVDGLAIPQPAATILIDFLEREKGATCRHGDADLLKDFETFQLSRAAHIALPEDASDAVCNNALKPGDLAFDRIINSRADTVAGVLAKLRIGFSGSSDCEWADDVVLAPENSRFREGLELDDCYTRMIYSGIEDLAAIAGVPILGAPTDKHLATVSPAGVGSPVLVLGQSL